jgi:hypothetical protein
MATVCHILPLGTNRIPTGFRPKAQGCDVVATLDINTNYFSTATRLRPFALTNDTGLLKPRIPGIIRLAAIPNR